MTSKYKLVPVEPTCEMIHAGQMAVSGFPRDVLERWQAMLAAAPEVDKVGFCEDTALSLAERTFSTEVDEQLAEDVIQYARRLHSRYAAPQPAEQQLYDSAAVRLDKQDAHYPPCDFCDAIPDHHPWHGSGMFKGFDRPHIHACNDCRHLLPSPDVAKLVVALEGLLAIVSDSSGVSGYHLNGDIAKWCEFEEVAMAEEALALYHP